MAEKIGQILIRKGKITPARLRDALRTQQFFGGYLGSHLINLGFIDEAALGETLSEIYRVPFAPYDSIRLASPEAIATIPSALARKFRVIPIQIEGKRLHLAMLNPRDSAALKDIAAATGLTIAPWVAPEFRIAHALDKHYRIRRERTIPLRPAGQAEAASSVPDAGGVYEPMPWDGTERRTSPRAAPAGAPESAAPGIGLDGHPLDASVLPDLGGTVSRPESDSPEWVPRSLQEWRDEDEPGHAAHPPRAAAPPAVSPVSPAASAASPASPRRAPGARSHGDSGSSPSPVASIREEAREAVRERIRRTPPRPAARSGTTETTGDAAARDAAVTVPASGKRRTLVTETEVADAPPEARGPSSASVGGEPIAAGSERAPDLDPAYESLLSEVSTATDREELVTRAIDVLSKSFRRVVAFSVKGAEARALGAGPGLDAAALADDAVPLDRPSIVSSAASFHGVHVAPPPGSESTRAFQDAMGGPSGSALVIPVALRERLVLVFYADNAEASIEALDLGLWKRLARICTISLEIFILKNRMRRL